MGQLSKELTVDHAGNVGECDTPDARESLGDDSKAEVVIRMCVSHIDRFQLFAGFGYFCDNAMGIRQSPLRVKQSGVRFSHNDDGGNLKTLFIAEESLGRKQFRPVIIDSDFH
jgi:hypothetical protein